MCGKVSLQNDGVPRMEKQKSSKTCRSKGVIRSSGIRIMHTHSDQLGKRKQKDKNTRQIETNKIGRHYRVRREESD